MSRGNNNDAAFYGGDNTQPPLTGPNADLSQRTPLDGSRVSSPNTSARYLSNVNMIEGAANASTATTADATSIKRIDANGQPCDFIDAKFNSNKNATYKVEVRDGNIYVTTEGQEPRISEPQRHHPARRQQTQAREQDYYNDQDVSSGPPYRAARGDYPPPPPPRPEYYLPPDQYAYDRPGYYRPEYRHHHNGVNVGGLIAGIALGALSHGRIGVGIGVGSGYGYGNNYDYDRYRSAPIGYDPSGFQPMNQGFMPPRYRQPYYGGRQYSYNVNPQYTSGEYPGNYYYDN